MNLGTAAALAIVVLGGMAHGSFALPMKRIERRWPWENLWLVYSVCGMVILPALAALASVPSISSVYRAAPLSTTLLVALFGLGWGTGSVLFGQAVSRIGMALGFAVILGITSVLGSLFPLLFLEPQAVWTARGRTLLLGLLIALAGIAICSSAGALRDREHRQANPGKAGGSFWAGLVVSILSGVLSPMLNFAFAFGVPLQNAAKAMGAGSSLAANAVWGPALLGGFLVNAGYAAYLIRRNRGWDLYRDGKHHLADWLGCAAMGLLWFGGIGIYGMGAAELGSLGAVVGWPVFTSTVILTANILGFLAGEWRHASRGARLREWLGIAVLVCAILVVSRAS